MPSPKIMLVSGIVALAALTGLVYYYVDKASAPQLQVLHEKVAYDVAVDAGTFTPKVGERVKFTFTVKKDGKPIDLPAQKIYPHPSVVSNDLGDVQFYHVDELPSTAAGVYEIEHTFVRASDYTIWFEINNNQTIDHHGRSSDFVGRLAIDVRDAAVNPETVPAYSTVAATSLAQSGNYTLLLLPAKLNAGIPGTFTVVAEKSDGTRLPLLPDFDHFYILAAPQQSLFYALGHPQLNKKGETTAVAGPITFPQAGKYALWIRVFPDDGSGQVTDAIQGALVLEVK